MFKVHLKKSLIESMGYQLNDVDKNQLAANIYYHLFEHISAYLSELRLPNSDIDSLIESINEINEDFNFVSKHLASLKDINQQHPSISTSITDYVSGAYFEKIRMLLNYLEEFIKTGHCSYNVGKNNDCTYVCLDIKSLMEELTLTSALEEEYNSVMSKALLKQAKQEFQNLKDYQNIDKSYEKIKKCCDFNFFDYSDIANDAESFLKLFNEKNLNI
ncbi:MAG: hypothetical protein CFH44_00691 [Proteobacteria bacterium]|nr:MAG: hypothetical protein CFH44_00691 [Pseudomonadota bacterium]